MCRFCNGSILPVFVSDAGKLAPPVACHGQPGIGHRWRAELRLCDLQQPPGRGVGDVGDLHLVEAQQPDLGGDLHRHGAHGVLLAPLAGTWADRHDRRTTMFVADLASGLLGLATLGLMLTGRLDVPALALVAALLATFSAFHTAAFEASQATLVPAEQLGRANGMMQASYALSSILAPPVAALLIAVPVHSVSGTVDGTPRVIALDCASFLVAATTLLFLRIPQPRRTPPDAGAAGPGFFADMLSGLRFLRARPALMWLLALFVVANVAIAPLQVLQPLLLKFDLAADWTARGLRFETALAVLQTAFGLGAVAGGVTLIVWGGPKHRLILAVLLPMILSGVTLVLLGLSSSLFVAAGLLFLTGTVPPVVNAASLTLWQRQTPLELQGRVFSVRRVISLSTAPLGTLLAGAASAAYAPGQVLATLAAGYLVFCVTQLFNSTLLHPRAPELQTPARKEISP